MSSFGIDEDNFNANGIWIKEELIISDFDVDEFYYSYAEDRASDFIEQCSQQSLLSLQEISELSKQSEKFLGEIIRIKEEPSEEESLNDVNGNVLRIPKRWTRHGHSAKCTARKIVNKKKRKKIWVQKLHKKNISTNLCKKLKLYRSQNLCHSLIRTERIFKKCHKCKKRYCKSTFLMHLTIHTQEKRYKCNECTKSFNFKPKLTSHKKIHIIKKCNDPRKAETVYECHKCNQIFKYESILHEHLAGCPNSVSSQPSAQVTESFKCPECKKEFDKNRDLMKHLLTHSQTKRYRRSRCKKKFVHRNNLTKHLLIRNNSNVHNESHECNNNYTKKSETGRSKGRNNSLDEKSSLRNHSWKEKYKCNDCEDSFNTKATLSLHIRAFHLIKRSFQCNICGKIYVTKKSTQRHFRNNHKMYIFRCKKCNCNFVKESDLTKHVSKHPQCKEKSENCNFESNTCKQNFNSESLLTKYLTQGEPYESDEKMTKNRELHNRAKESRLICKYCNEKFTEKSDLSKHLLIHTDGKNNCKKKKIFECNICKRIFPSKCFLSQHLAIHTGKARTECKKCGKNFTTNGILIKHFALHHEGRMFQCDICKRIFDQKSNLIKHLLIHEQNKFECKECGRKFSSSSKLTRHLVVHSREISYECKKCNKKFTRPGNLKTHLITHTEKYQCNYSSNVNDKRKKECDFNTTKRNDSSKAVNTAENTQNCNITRNDSSSVNSNRKKGRDCNTTKQNDSYKIIDNEKRVQKYKNTEKNDSFGIISNAEKGSDCNNTKQSNSYMTIDDVKRLQNRSNTTKNDSSNSVNIKERVKDSYEQQKNSRDVISNAKKTHECPECKKQFPFKSFLIGHLLVHIKKRPYECMKCDQKFCRKRDLLMHLRTHNKERQCDQCKKIFTTQSDFKRHLLIHMINNVKENNSHENEKLYECNECKIRLKRKCYLSRHLIRHMKRHLCEKCKKNFVNLYKHVLTHAKKESAPELAPDDSSASKYFHDCIVCDKSFPSKSHLGMHYIFYHKGLPFKCGKCEKRFFRMPDLKKHLMIHTRGNVDCNKNESTVKQKKHLVIHTQKDIKCNRIESTVKKNSVVTVKPTYECKECEISFNHMSHFSRHLLIHTGERPHKCSKCEKVFRCSYELNSHFIRIHTELKPFKCSLCEKKYPMKDDLNRHFKINHADEDEHSQKMQHKSSDISHKKYECEICKKFCSSKETLHIHSLVHRERPYKCKKCNRGFIRRCDLSKHTAIHIVNSYE